MVELPADFPSQVLQFGLGRGTRLSGGSPLWLHTPLCMFSFAVQCLLSMIKLDCESLGGCFTVTSSSQRKESIKGFTINYFSAFSAAELMCNGRQVFPDGWWIIAWRPVDKTFSSAAWVTTPSGCCLGNYWFFVFCVAGLTTLSLDIGGTGFLPCRSLT